MKSRRRRWTLVLGVLGIACGGALAAGCKEPNPEWCVRSGCAAGFTCDKRLGRCLPVEIDGGALSGGGGRADGGQGSDSGPADAHLAQDVPGSSEGGAPIAQADGGAPDGGGGADAPSGMVSLAIRSPGPMTYTNGTVEFDVAVTGAAPERVEIRTGTQVLASLPPAGSYRFSWDTRMVPEGTYDIVVRAVLGAQATMAGPVKVVVDRTAPVVTGRMPAAGAEQVSLQDPIQIAFSEPIASSSVNEASISLTREGTAVPKTVQLSADGRTLTIEIKEPGALVLPANVAAASVTTLADLAGNALQTFSWSWTFPLWMKLGEFDGQYPEVAISDTGTIYVARTVPSGFVASYRVQVSRYEANGTWTFLGTPSGELAERFASIATGTNGTPFVAWAEGKGLRIARWNGTAWDSIPMLGASGDTGATIDEVSLALFGDLPVVAWSQTSGVGRSVHAARWTGASWNGEFGKVVDGGLAPHVALDKAGNPLLAWLGGSSDVGVGRWNPGEGWVFGPSLAHSTIHGSAPSFVMDALSDGPVATVAGTGAVAVKTIVAGPLWTDLVPPIATEARMVAAPQIVLDANRAPIVAWSEETGGVRSIRMARWRNGAWDRSYGVVSGDAGPNTHADFPSLALGRGGAPVIAWSEWTSSGDKVFVWRANR